VPIGLTVFPFAIRSLPSGASHPNLKLDIGGVLLIGLALVAIIYPLIQGQTDGWPAWTFALLAAGAALLYVFVRYERRRSHNALIEPSLFANRMYLSGIAVMLSLFGAFGGLLLCVSLYGQLGEGWSPIHAGLTLTPMVAGMIVGMLVSGMLVKRLGRHLLHIGILFIAVGTTTLALMLTGMHSASTLAPSSSRCSNTTPRPTLSGSPHGPASYPWQPPSSSCSYCPNTRGKKKDCSKAGYRLGSDRGSPNHGSTLASKRVMAQIWSPARVST
jgi:hypothetical protein